MSLWSPPAIEALILCLVLVLFRDRKTSQCQLQDGFVLVDLSGFLCAEISSGASASGLSRVPGVLVRQEINCCVIIKVAISRSELRYPTINSQHLEYFTLSLWVNSSFSAASLPSFTDGEFSSKLAINNTNNNNKKLLLFYVFSTDNSLWKSPVFLAEEVAMATVHAGFNSRAG